MRSRYIAAASTHAVMKQSAIRQFLLHTVGKAALYVGSPRDCAAPAARVLQAHPPHDPRTQAWPSPIFRRRRHPRRR
ncbi:hypothetical protein [Lysobacter gummosus]|uniref:hypothetical protein n=1 Tax=Lysobacter gummosus TaxID=262324 RepID=UPI00363689E7